jgi:hypothetical protein
MNPLRGSTPPTRHGAQVPADLDGQLTHAGVAGERQIYAICARRCPEFGDPAMTQASANHARCWRMT